MLFQFVYNKILTVPNKGLWNKVLLRVLILLRKIILRFNDPLVKYSIGKFPLLLPLSHNLPLYRKDYPNYGSNVGRIAKFVKQKYPTLTFIDVGANIADSVAVIRSEIDCPILCIEGSKRYFGILKKNSALFSNVFVEMVYVSNKTGYAKLKMQEDSGTAHLYEDKVGEVYTKTLRDILENYPIFLKSKMIKIDTDGFDCIILRGSLDFLARAKPVIFFEYHPFLLSKQNEDSISIFAFLHSIGYETALVYDNFGNYMLSTRLMNSLLIEEVHNYFFCRGGSCYSDIVVFHYEDGDLFERIRLTELQFFRTAASGNYSRASP